MTEAAPPAPAPYSDFVEVGGLLFLSGRVALDERTGRLVGGDVFSQTRQVIRNAEAVLARAGVSLADVVKCTVYLTDMDDLPEVNRAYCEAMPAPLPARTAVSVLGLPHNGKVEIDMIARRVRVD